MKGTINKTNYKSYRVPFIDEFIKGFEYYYITESFLPDYSKITNNYCSILEGSSFRPCSIKNYYLKDDFAYVDIQTFTLTKYNKIILTKNDKIIKDVSVDEYLFKPISEIGIIAPFSFPQSTYVDKLKELSWKPIHPNKQHCIIKKYKIGTPNCLFWGGNPLSIPELKNRLEQDLKNGNIRAEGELKSYYNANKNNDKNWIILNYTNNVYYAESKVLGLNYRYKLWYEITYPAYSKNLIGTYLKSKVFNSEYEMLTFINNNRLISRLIKYSIYQNNKFIKNYSYNQDYKPVEIINKKNLEVKDMPMKSKKYEIKNKDLKRLEYLSTLANRSLNQEKELFELSDRNIQKLVEFEQKFKTSTFNACPTSIGMFNEVLKEPFRKPTLKQEIILERFYQRFDQGIGKNIIEKYKNNSKPKFKHQKRQFAISYAKNGFDSKGLPIFQITKNCWGPSLKKTCRNYKIPINHLIWVKEYVKHPDENWAPASKPVITLYERKYKSKRKSYSVTNQIKPIDKLITIRFKDTVDIRRVPKSQTLDGTYAMNEWKYCSKSKYKSIKGRGHKTVRAPKLVKVKEANLISRARNNREEVEITYRKNKKEYKGKTFRIPEETRKEIITAKKENKVVILEQSTTPYSDERQRLTSGLPKHEKQMERDIKRGQKRINQEKLRNDREKRKLGFKQVICYKDPINKTGKYLVWIKPTKSTVVLRTGELLKHNKYKLKNAKTNDSNNANRVKNNKVKTILGSDAIKTKATKT